MLKKAGIVVAAGAATLLAVSPLAFAGDSSEYGHDGSHHGASNIAEKNSKGLVNVSGNNVNLPVQACNNDLVRGNVLSGAIGLLSKGAVDNGDDSTRACEQESQSGDDVSQVSGEHGHGSDDSDRGTK